MSKFTKNENDDIQLKDVVSFLIRIKFWLISSALMAVIGSLVQRHHNPRFVTSAVVQVQKPDNSPLQAVTEKIVGAGSGLDGSARDFIENSKNYFNSSETFREVAGRILARPDAADIMKGLTLETNPLDLNLSSTQAAFQEAQQQLQLANQIAELSGVEAINNESIKIWVKSNSPKASIVVVNIIAEVGTIKIRENNLKEFDEVKDFVRARLENVESQIRADQAAVITVGKKIGMVAGENLSDLPAPIIKLRQEIATAESERQHRMNLLEELQKRFKLGQTGFDSVTKYEKIQDELKYWSSAIISKQETLAKLMASSRASPQNEQEYYDKSKKVEFNYKYYGALSNQLLQIEMMEISIANKIRLSERGSEGNTYDTRSASGAIYTALLAALMTSIVIALGMYILESINPPVRNRRDLSDLAISYLGEIPDLNQQKFQIINEFKKKTFEERQKHFLWSNIKNGKLVESIETMLFKALRSKLLRMQPDESTHMVVAITSAKSSEGKTTISSNLATVLGTSKRGTILVDCDLRQCGLTKELHFDTRLGLSDFLHGAVNSIDEITYTNELGLKIIPAGTNCTDVVEILLSDRFVELIEKLRADNEFVILDCPPVLRIAETSFIAKNSNVTLVSVVQNVTRIDDASQAVEDLTFHGVQRIAYILNFCGTLSKDNYLYGFNKSA